MPSRCLLDLAGRGQTLSTSVGAGRGRCRSAHSTLQRARQGEPESAQPRQRRPSRKAAHSALSSASSSRCQPPLQELALGVGRGAGERARQVRDGQLALADSAMELT